MKSIVAVEIHRPRREVAMLLADPANMTRWMNNLAAYEYIDGEPGAIGVRYRMVGKPGTRQQTFVATVTAMHLPEWYSLALKSPTVDVLVDVTFTALAKDRTKLRSEETFTFHGVFRRLFSTFAHGDIRKHHREHMESFKRFAEGVHH
jgi:hypothetical protein